MPFACDPLKYGPEARAGSPAVLSLLLCIMGALGRCEGRWGPVPPCLGAAGGGWLWPHDITQSNKGSPLRLPLVKCSFSYLYLCVHYIAGAEIFPLGNENNF